MKKRKLLFLVLLILIILVVLSLFKNSEKDVLEQEQENNSGQTELVDLEQICFKKDTTFSMSIKEAEEISKNSECKEQGNLLDFYICNEITGTWWIELETEKEGCNPACVVDVETKEAVINWRCTGLLIPQTE